MQIRPNALLNDNVDKYISILNNKAKSFYRQHPRLKKFKQPNEIESIVIERIMRLGTECITVKATTEDELYHLAVASLEEDYINFFKSDDMIDLTSTNALEILFSKQDDSDTKFFLCYQDEKSEIFKVNTKEISILPNRYTFGQIPLYGSIPTLY